MVTVLLPGEEDWFDHQRAKPICREFKLEALRRMEAGENVSVLARELGVSAPNDNFAAECIQDDSEIAELLRQMHLSCLT